MSTQVHGCTRSEAEAECNTKWRLVYSRLKNPSSKKKLMRGVVERFGEFGRACWMKRLGIELAFSTKSDLTIHSNDSFVRDYFSKHSCFTKSPQL